MKNYVLLILFLVSIFACEQQKSDRIEAKFERFEIKRGTNLSHWLSQSSRRGAEREAYITRDDIEYIKSLGFDHVRIPMDEEQMWNEAGAREADAFALLDSGLQWAYDNGLRAIVDLHILRSHHFNAEEKPLWTDTTEQEQFIDLWRDLSTALNKWPETMVAYELMNEPVADDPELWNNLVARAVTAIRELEPTRKIVIGSNRFQSAHTFDELKLPEKDTNIVLSYHFYEPFLLTHYQAGWTFLDDYKGPVQYPGQLIPAEAWNDISPDYQQRLGNLKDKTYNKETLKNMMAKPFNKAEKTGFILYCGEFGVIDNAPREDMLNWYRDMIAVFEENNVAFANWDYKSNSFGLVNEQGEPDQELIDIVLGK